MPPSTSAPKFVKGIRVAEDSKRGQKDTFIVVIDAADPAGALESALDDKLGYEEITSYEIFKAHDVG